MTTSPLAQPGFIGNLELPNRFVMAPMTRAASNNRVPDDAVAAYYRKRAEGGVGLIITEGVLVAEASNVAPDGVPVLTADTVTAWGQVVSAVHAAGGRIFPQLWHLGAYDGSDGPPELRSSGIGPSGTDAHGQPFGTEASQADLARITAAFVDGALAAQAAGFDGVEIHGAHGFLIDQFLWGETNKREDRYGVHESQGTVLATEIVQAVRAAVGPVFPIIVRLSQWKIGHYDAQIARDERELGGIVRPLAAAGVDAFHVSARRYWQPAFSGTEHTLAGLIRRLTGKPSITVGSLGLLDSDFESAFSGASTPGDGIERAASLYEAGEFDFIALGRALISDPDWVNKTLSGSHTELLGFDPADLATLH